MSPPTPAGLPVASSSSRARNLVAFWLLGLLNNLAYVVMLSAAHDLLTHTIPHNSTANHSQVEPTPNPRDCNPMSTGTILLADILPAVLVKMVAPFLLVSIHSRMTAVCLLSGLSFLLTGLSPPGPLLFLGEVSLLPHTQSCPGQGVLPAWASGTGAAGVLGAGSYAALTALGVGARQSLLLMLWVPVGLALVFWVLLVPHKLPLPGQENQESLLEDQEPLLEDQELLSEDQLPESDIEQNPDLPLSVWEKLLLVSGLFKYMLPLGLVYFFEYLINQGLYELVYFPDTWLDHGAQYRAYQLTYQIGVLFSRSSLPFLVIHNIWMLAWLQLVFLVMFLVQGLTWLVAPGPGLPLTLALVLGEGLLGGAAYVNTFHRVSQETSGSSREFSLALTSLADSSAIGLAGLLAIPLHNWLCQRPVGL